MMSLGEGRVEAAETVNAVEVMNAVPGGEQVQVGGIPVASRLEAPLSRILIDLTSWHPSANTVSLAKGFDSCGCLALTRHRARLSGPPLTPLTDSCSRGVRFDRLP